MQSWRGKTADIRLQELRDHKSFFLSMKTQTILSPIVARCSSCILAGAALGYLILGGMASQLSAAELSGQDLVKYREQLRLLGLGPSHPLVVAVDKAIIAKSSFEPPESSPKPDEDSKEDYQFTLHGRKVKAAAMIILLPDYADPAHVLEAADAMYSVLGDRRLRSKILAVYPIENGAIVLIPPEFAGDLASHISQTRRSFGIQGGPASLVFRSEYWRPEVAAIHEKQAGESSSSANIPSEPPRQPESRPSTQPNSAPKE